MSREDEVTKVQCLVCQGRGRSAFMPCPDCVGLGMVTPDEQARQRLQWPEKRNPEP